MTAPKKKGLLARAATAITGYHSDAEWQCWVWERPEPFIGQIDGVDVRGAFRGAVKSFPRAATKELRAAGWTYVRDVESAPTPPEPVAVAEIQPAHTYAQHSYRHEDLRPPKGEYHAVAAELAATVAASQEALDVAKAANDAAQAASSAAMVAQGDAVIAERATELQAVESESTSDWQDASRARVAHAQANARLRAATATAQETARALATASRDHELALMREHTHAANGWRIAADPYFKRMADLEAELHECGCELLVAMAEIGAHATKANWLAERIGAEVSMVRMPNYNQLAMTLGSIIREQCASDDRGCAGRWLPVTSGDILRVSMNRPHTMVKAGRH